MQVRSRARLALLRATEEALDRYPEHTVAVVRSALERSARRRTGSRFDARTMTLALTIRAIDVHPVVAERLVRLWLRRAAQQHRAAQQRRVAELSS